MNMPRSNPVLQFRLAMAGVTATEGEHESRKSCGTWARSAVSASVIDGVGPGAPVGGMVNGGKLMPGEVAGAVGGAVVAGAVVAGAVVAGAVVSGVAVADAGVLVGLGVGVTCAAAVGDAAGAKGPSPNAYIPPTPNRSRTARPMAPITSNDGPPRLGGGAP